MLTQLFSFLGAIFLLISTFSKSKNKMLMLQVADCGFNVLGNIFAGNFAAVATLITCIIRNLLITHKKITKLSISILLLSVTTIGLIVNTKGLIGLLPIMATIEYSIVTFKTDSIKIVKSSLLLNLILWSIHDILTGLYPIFIADCVITSSLIYNLLKSETTP